MNSAGDLEDQLRRLVHRSPWLMRALAMVRGLELESWCIGAGAVRNLVWDHLHGHELPSTLADVDVAYFAPLESPGVERQHETALESACPDLPWEVTNQAHVHLWFEQHFGHPVAPLTSLSAAIASWPEYATSVGVTLDSDDEVQVIAPLGLEDLFAMRVRRNPVRVSLATYRARTRAKRYIDRWPRVEVLED